MKPMNTLRAAVLFALTLSSVALSQAPPVTVEFDINLPNYDVIYLSDFVNVRDLTLASNIPDMSIEMRTVPSNQNIRVYLRLRAAIQLRGESKPELLVAGYTNDFDLNGSRRLSSKDLSGSGARGISVTTERNVASEGLRSKLEDYIKRFPSAPPGDYYFELQCFSAGNITPAIPRDVKLGEGREVISIRNASESEVNVTLISPEQGENVPTPNPTFTWTSEKPDVTLYVYEKLPFHRSGLEAIERGNPILVQQLRNVSTFTLGADAQRRLQDCKSYYWFVETSVLTSDGIKPRRSEIRLFRVGARANLIAFLNNLPNDARSAIEQKIQEGWTVPCDVAMILDGKPVRQEELIVLFQKLVRDNVAVTVTLEDQ